MVLYSCACVYLWYASSMFIADHFVSVYVLCNEKKRKYVKKDVKCFMLVC